MANAKTTALTENTDPLGSDLEYMVDDPGGTPASRKLYKGSNNLEPDGFAKNYKLSITVSSNNLSVAIKGKSGNDPSTTNPVSVWMNGTYRRITAGLSATANAGQNYFNSGSAVTAATEIDYFVYLIWNTTPATDIMSIGFSRIPYGRVFSDFSATVTNDKYIYVTSGSTPTSTDDVVLIGRFAATLSASASFNWSVPTFTNTNLIQFPIFRTRRLTFIPSPTGYSAVPTNTMYQYQITNDSCEVWVRETTNGTSNATTLTMTAPISSASVTNGSWDGFGFGLDNSAALTTTVRADISSAASTIAFFPNGSASSTWTNSCGKRIAAGYLKYPI